MEIKEIIRKQIEKNYFFSSGWNIENVNINEETHEFMYGTIKVKKSKEIAEYRFIYSNILGEVIYSNMRK